MSLLLESLQQLGQRADRVAAAITDALAGVATFQALEGELPGLFALSRYARELAREIDMHGTCTADRELIIILAVAVDEELCVLDVFAIEVDGARHATLLIHRHDKAQRAVLPGMLHDIAADGHADAVIAAEARAYSLEVLVRTVQLDGVVLRVELHAFLSHADHIHMALQNRTRCLLVARCRRLVRDDIIDARQRLELGEDTIDDGTILYHEKRLPPA